MRLNPLKTNFTAGEVSRLTYGRVDQSRYNNGAKLMENVIVQPQGGFLMRSGTRFVDSVKDHNNYVRLIPFGFSESQSYVLEFGQNYIRFYRDGVQITDSATNLPIEVSTTFLAIDLRVFHYAQSADTLYLAHNGYPPMKLQRFSDTVWTLTAISFLDGPYLDANNDSTKTITYVDGSAGTGRVVTASDPRWTAQDVGRLMRVEDGALSGWCTITTFTSTTQVSVTVPVGVTLPHATTNIIGWRLGAWGASTGYPATVAFFQQRLVYAGSVAQPQTIWFSQVADFENFAPTESNLTVIDSDAITYTIDSKKVNHIQWLDPATALLIGTVGGEWIAQEANTTQSLSPTNIQIIIQSTNGSNQVIPQRIGSDVVFVQRSGRKVKEIGYQFAINAYVPRDISIWSEHLPRRGGGIVDMAYQQEPFSIVWFVRADGVLLGLTHMKEQEVAGWHHHIIGGAYQDGAAVVESICCVPKSDASVDQLYMVVKRTINGATKRYIEYLEDMFFAEDENDKDNMFFMDSGLTYTGAAATNFTAAHLPASTLAVLANGAAQKQVLTNASGQFTIPKASTIVSAGFPYTAIVDTLPPYYQTSGESNRGLVSSIEKITVSYLDSLAPSFRSTDAGKVRRINFRKSADPMDSSPPLFSGDFDLPLDAYTTLEPSIRLLQDQPYPLCVTSISYHMTSFK